MNYFNNFIIIDDDKINNKLCRKILEKTYPDADIKDFLEAQQGLDYIKEKYSHPGHNERAILLLDIIMPVMDAWEFLEKFDELDETVKSRIKIYILSSSVDKKDMARAQSNKHVEYYLIKPLNMESIRLIVHVLHRRLGLL
jgi:response regulator RpfG family c-di-GMP phosphodiesterase